MNVYSERIRIQQNQLLCNLCFGVIIREHKSNSQEPNKTVSFIAKFPRYGSQDDKTNSV